MLVRDKVLDNAASRIKCPACETVFTPQDIERPAGPTPAASPAAAAGVANRFRQGLTEGDNQSGERERAADLKEGVDGKKVFGWLVVHDEHAPSQTFELAQVKTLAGRADPGRPCEVMIQTSDRYMSRNHFTIEVIGRGKEHLYLLKDFGSKGGTYVETKPLGRFKKEMRRLGAEEEVYIDDGAIIQAGRTKIFFKSATAVRSAREATVLIGQQEFTKTVIL